LTQKYNPPHENVGITQLGNESTSQNNWLA